LLVIVALVAGAAVALVDSFRSSSRSSMPRAPRTTPSAHTLPTLTDLPAFSGTTEVRIEEIGNAWAELYAAASPDACRYMAAPLCELEPLPSFRRSFDGATVQDIAFPTKHDAGAMFSKGIVVEFWGGGEQWTIIKVAAVGRHFFQ
jgi:hypothetical protein